MYIVFPRLRNGPFSGFVIGTGPSRGSVSIYRVVMIIKSRSHQQKNQKNKNPTAALGFSSPPTQPVPTHCLDREGRRYRARCLVLRRGNSLIQTWPASAECVCVCALFVCVCVSEVGGTRGAGERRKKQATSSCCAESGPGTIKPGERRKLSGFRPGDRTTLRLFWIRRTRK